MSNIQSVRAKLRAWLSSKIRIDDWDLDSPKRLFNLASTALLPLPANSAIAYPVKDLQYDKEGPQTISGSGAFTFSFVYRYSGMLTAEELPTDKVEAIAQFIHASALLELSGCSGIRNAEPEIEEFPVMFSRADDEQSDWLVYFHLVLRVRFSLTEFALPPEFGPPGAVPDPTVPLDELMLKTYRAYTGFNVDDPADSTLDSTIIMRND